MQRADVRRQRRGRHRGDRTWLPPTTQDAHELPWEQNPNFLTAMNALGMTSVGTDASKPYPNPADHAVRHRGQLHRRRPTRSNAAVPRRHVRGRAPAPDQHLLQQLDRDPGGRRVQHDLRRLADGGNCVNTSITTCLTTPATFADIVNSVVDRHVREHDQQRPAADVRAPDEHHGHRARHDSRRRRPTRRPTIGDGLLYSVLNPLLAEVPHVLQRDRADPAADDGCDRHDPGAAEPDGPPRSRRARRVRPTRSPLRRPAAPSPSRTTAPRRLPYRSPCRRDRRSVASRSVSAYGGALSAWQTLAAGATVTITVPFTATATTGMLRVTTSPALPSQIIVDGTPSDSWGLAWVHLAPGSHTVSFTHIEGYTDPAPQTVTVTAGVTTTVTGTFTQRGTLRVITSPAVPSTISVDGIPRERLGHVDRHPGRIPPSVLRCGPRPHHARVPDRDRHRRRPHHDHRHVRHEHVHHRTDRRDVASYDLARVAVADLDRRQPRRQLGPRVGPPAGRHPHGELHAHRGLHRSRAADRDDHQRRDHDRDRNVHATRHTARHHEPGRAVHHQCRRHPRDDYGMWTDIPAGSHQVCFGAVAGLTTPACQTATVTAGALTTITGTFA